MGQPCAATTTARASVTSTRSRRTGWSSAPTTRSAHGQFVDTRASNTREATTQSESRELSKLVGRASTDRSLTTTKCRGRIRYIGTGKAQGQVMGTITKSCPTWPVFRVRQLTVGTGWTPILSLRSKQQLWKHWQCWWETAGLLWRHVFEFSMERERRPLRATEWRIRRWRTSTPTRATRWTYGPAERTAHALIMFLLHSARRNGVVSWSLLGRQHRFCRLDSMAPVT